VGVIMKKFVSVTTMVVLLVGVNGCAVSNGNTLDKSFEEYKTYKSNKAMAVAMDKDGRYAIGYSSEYSSQKRANKRAIDQCTNANNNSEYKVNAKCEIYAINDEIVRKLD